MTRIYRIKLAHRITSTGLIILISVGVIGSSHDTAFATSGDEAPDSTIALQMPFIAGQMWTVGGAGGGGSFYGDGFHTNANNDYYATDWNIVGGPTADLGKAVLSVAKGTVSLVLAPPCPNTGVGCFVQIDHADGYLTKYGHLSAVSVTANSNVRTGALIGAVGNSGPAGLSPHLHLRFQRNGSSRCNTVVYPSTTCTNLEDPQAPQGHKPSPMMTTLGPITLVNGSTYTSINRRVSLPDLRNTTDGWVSEIHVQNLSAFARTISVQYFDANGTPGTSASCYLVSLMRCWISVNGSGQLPYGTNGSAIVNGGEYLNVVTFQTKSGRRDADNGFLPADSGDPAFESAATIQYAPAFYNAAYGWSSSLTVLNASSTNANVFLIFKGRTIDYTDDTLSFTLSPNARYTLNSSLFFNSMWLGSVVIIANQSVATRVTNTHTDQSTATYNANAATSGASTVFVPAAYKGNYKLTTGLIVQNLGTVDTNVTVYFYDRDGTPRTSYNLGTLSPKIAAGILLSYVVGLPDINGSGWAGSARIVSYPSQPLAAVSRGDWTDGGYYFHSAASQPGSTVYLPRMAKNNSGRTTSYLVQNTSTIASCSVTAYYYDTAGVEVVAERETYPLAAYGSAGRYQGGDVNLPDGWAGSIVLEATCGTLVAVGRESTTDSTTTSAWNALAR